MIRNPYRYTGPLDPREDELVLVPRSMQLNRVVESIKKGDYWAILGPREIGKTTFLRQIEDQLKDAYHLYLNLEVPAKTEEGFYEWLIEEFTAKIPSQKIKKGKRRDPARRFLHFLENLIPREDKKIVLQFDEIEGIPGLKKFCHIWRNIYHNRYHKSQLKKYSVVITGSAELVALTTGPKSPFNIIEKLYMKDFSIEESERLIDRPFASLNIKIEPGVKERLISQLSGHPKMLQQACFNLVEIANREKRNISEADVDAAIDLLFIENTTIDTLSQTLKDNTLKKLIREILNGEKKKFHPFKEYSIKGPGPIAEGENSLCEIRNQVFKKFFMDMLNFVDDESRFQISQEVGKGGMGIVYKAKDTVLDRTVAIKKLNSDLIRNKDNLENLYNEARANAKLRHRNIVSVYDIKQIKDDHFIIMEFVEGLDYKKILEKEKQLPLDEILFVAKSLFAALDFSHKKGVIHRDVKPQHIIKDKENEIKIVDFGIAIIGDTYDKNKEDGYIMGSPNYISPEQITGNEADHRSDIYSAGVTLYELVTGRPLFKGSRDEILRKHLLKTVPPVRKFREDIPFELAQIIETCLKKKKEERYQDAGEILQRLEAFEKKLEKPGAGNGTAKIHDTAFIEKNPGYRIRKSKRKKKSEPPDVPDTREPLKETPIKNDLKYGESTDETEKSLKK